MGEGSLVVPIRPWRPEEDRNRVLTDWTSVNRKNAPFRWMSKDVYQSHDKKIKRILPFCDVLIACDPVNSSVIYGWAVGFRSANVVHMIFVRPGDFRKNGIGSSLFNAMFPDRPELVTYTHHTRAIRDYKLDEKWNLEYNPYVIDWSLELERL